MEYLILTESSPTGKNMKIAEDIKKIIEASCDKISNEVTVLSSFKMSNIIHGSIELYDHIVMVVPEWNGSFPYTLKQLIDNSEWPSHFENKKVTLIGTCGSMESNFEGIKHLRHILDYIGAIVNSESVYIKGLSKDLPKEHYRSETDQLVNIIIDICSTSISS